MRKCVQGYARRLLELYRPEQIILYRAFCKEHYRDKEGRIHPFTDWEKYNAVFYRQLNTYLASLYRELEQQLGCRVLCQSGDVMGDEANQWGLSPFHYRQEDYEHVFQSLEELLLPSS